MASPTRGVWAIDIGNNALKALRLRPADNGLEVIGFDYIEYDVVLSGEEVTEDEREQAVEKALHTFAERNEIAKDEVALAIGGQSSFSRFLKLPPVEQKRIPEIVQYEAVQQIPFDINEVEWDWQLMENPDSPDREVGIFAVKNELISGLLAHFGREDLPVSLVQVGPMALYNYAYYDRSDIAEGGKPTVILDMGAENTTLVVCSKNAVWQRSIRIGGNAFTEAIADAFKLSFRKAEKLKRTAPMSKYMRQIFTAMKPVYTDLGSEIQRSLGFYTSSGGGREKGFARIIALGGGMKLQGLAKYLQQTLNVPVVRPDSFERLQLAPEVSAAKFHENIGDFGIVYGLGTQVLGEAKVDVNLLPRRIARQMAWARKAKYFTAAAALLFGVSLLSLVNLQYAKSQYKGQASVRTQYARILSDAKAVESQLQEQKNRAKPADEKIEKCMSLFDKRELIPHLNETILSCLPNEENNPDQAALYTAFKNGNLDAITSIPRPQREQLFVTRLGIEYADDLETARFTDPGKGRRSGGYGYGGAGRERYDEGRYIDPAARAEAEGYGYGAYGGAAAQPVATTKGFLVTLEGYSPYANISALLDPPGVASSDDQSAWGLVTRFENLQKLFPETQFSLYKKNDVKNHFKMQTGEIELKGEGMPLGIGVEKEMQRVSVEDAGTGTNATRYPTRATGGEYGMSAPQRITAEPVLVDPMTGEEISKVFDIVTQREVDADASLSEQDLGRVEYDQFGKPKYLVRDHWFRLQVKFEWKDPSQPQNPATPQNVGRTGGAGAPYGRGR